MWAWACAGDGAGRGPEVGLLMIPTCLQTHVCVLKRPIFVHRNATTKARAPIDPTSAWPIRIQRLRMSWMGWMVSGGMARILLERCLGPQAKGQQGRRELCLLRASCQPEYTCGIFASCLVGMGKRSTRVLATTNKPETLAPGSAGASAGSRRPRPRSRTALFSGLLSSPVSMLGAIVRALKRPIFVQEKTAVETARPLLVRGDLTDAGYPTAEAALGPRG